MLLDYLKNKLKGAPGIAITEIAAEIWSNYEYTVDTQPETPVEGVDIIATRSRPYQRKEVIQVIQAREGAIGISSIQQASALPKQENADNVILVTTGSVEDDALSLAADLDVKVVDGEEFCGTIHSAGFYSTVAEFVSIDDTRQQTIQLETMVDRIVSNTAIDVKKPVFEVLRSYFEGHPTAPSVESNRTLASFGGSETQDEWKHSTTIRWSTKPQLEADTIADNLAEELRKQDVATVESWVIASVISFELDESLGEPLETASPSELAEWFVQDFSEVEIPLVAKDPGLAVDLAEDIIDVNESVASNKLRVAGKLNLRYDEMYEHV
jgi:hypothetical protein